MALKLGELVAYLRADNSHFDRGVEASQRRLRDLAREFDRTGNRSLLGDIDAERSRLGQLSRAANELGTGGLATARNALSNFGTATTNVFTNIWNLIPIILGVAAAMNFWVPTIYVVGGALGSLPALAAGAGAAIGVLVLGFMGLSDQFKKTASAGGAVVDKAWQIAQAERRVRDANLEVLAATEALTRSRETAAKRIDDLNRSIAGAHLDEKAAVLAVADAQEKLDKARMWGGGDDVRRAQLAYDQAAQSLDDIRARIQDMEKEQQRNAQQGVEGSDEVRAAYDRQRKAVEGVTDAQHALAEARKPAPGGGGAADEIMKIAPAAKAAVDVIKQLKPAFDDLRLDVQQRLFAGVASEIKGLATAWFPQLHKSLGDMADMFNGVLKTFTQSASQPTFITNIGKGIDSVKDALDMIGRAVAGPLVDAFGRLAGAAGPFIRQFGFEIARVVADFSAWIKKSDESGSLTDFFQKAAGYLHDIFDIGRDVFSIIGSIFSILLGSPAEKVGKSQFEQLKEGMDGIAAWFKDPKNQQMIRDWMQKIEDAVKWFVDEGIPKIEGWVKKIDGWINRADEWGNRIIRFKNDVVGAFNEVVGFFTGLPGRISAATSGMFNGISNAFRSAINTVIYGWNRLSFTIGGGSFMGIPVPSATFYTPDIPYLADGGVVRATPGGRLAVVGEGGRDEAVIPLDRLAAMLGGGRGTTRVVAETNDDLLSLLFQAIRWKVQGEYGGSVEDAFAGV